MSHDYRSIFSSNADDAFECLVVTKKRLPIFKGFHALIVMREIGHLDRNNSRFRRVYPVPHMPHKVAGDRDLVKGGRCTGQDDAGYDLQCN